MAVKPFTSYLKKKKTTNHQIYSSKINAYSFSLQAVSAPPFPNTLASRILLHMCIFFSVFHLKYYFVLNTSSSYGFAKKTTYFNQSNLLYIHLYTIFFLTIRHYSQLFNTSCTCVIKFWLFFGIMVVNCFHLFIQNSFTIKLQIKVTIQLFGRFLAKIWRFYH